MAELSPEKIVLECQLTFPEFQHPGRATGIVSSRSFRDGRWSELCQLKTEFEEVSKRVIPIDFRDFCMIVLTEVAPCTSVTEHGHKEGIARYITEGSLILNGQTYEAGDWILVPEGMTYEIYTETGYRAVEGYLQACGT
jgi:hypothetical protein